MSETKPSPDNKDVREYAGGWITERKGTDVPGFLKLAFPVIGLFCVGYLVVYMNGEINHADRGTLVQKFNAATESSPGLMYLVTVLALIYVMLAVVFAIRKYHEDK